MSTNEPSPLHLTSADEIIIANLSGRGDKDVAQAAEFILGGKKP